MYYDADLLLLDDILAAVDSHVAALVFDAVRQLNDATRILVTHALHFLPQVDYIITMHQGRVAERGTYVELRSAKGPFASLLNAFASECRSEEGAEKEKGALEPAIGRPPSIPRERLTGNVQNALDSKETMATGTVGLYVYKGYLKAGRGWITLPLLLAAIVISQGLTIMNSYWLVYAALGLGAAFAFFLMGAAQAYLCFFASIQLHDAAMQRIMRAPQSFFDVTPKGRLLNRLLKDIDTLDDDLASDLRALLITIFNLVGSLVLISIMQPYFLIAVVLVLIISGHLAVWYQRSALMLKRIDASFELIRGAIVSSQRITNALGGVLVFVVAIIVVCSDTVSPATSGPILSCSVSIQRAFSVLVRQSASVQNDSNSVDRVLEYANQLEQEAAHDIAETKPPAAGPRTARIKFENVVMSYRVGLPPALKNFESRFDISKIGLHDLRHGISILPQEPLLFSGTIRSNLDPFGQKTDQELWHAMRRAHLIDSTTAEQRTRKSMSINRASEEGMNGSGTHTPTLCFSLDSPVEDEGANLSVGQGSLISLARALVRDAPIVVLDEATAALHTMWAVDLETDAKIQETIRREFKNKTLLCIAHRLRTILSYDKILVMDKGAAVEYDTPENLFRQGGIFYSMCDKSNITIEDIEASTRPVNTPRLLLADR
ncbi:hypothetical protein QFC19_003413 [Naganishia cerealis]|uniref:Uncharacterized protein n=1 Tax=Naganishia cerealis TaxID=610337 RepID=A0ACC2W368_9TREE|nr:hypothetical protein QFC19_003413 [Naganishia cerealis]